MLRAFLKPHRWGCWMQRAQRLLSQRRLPTREQQLAALKSEQYDVLVVGGGAIGCGCALEAATRGLKTALVEAADFASGASSKSSKLIEGSSSYMNAALQHGDVQQIYMLEQLLKERATMLHIAPHLNRVQPMLMPIYNALSLPLYWLGLKLYDVLAGNANVRGSHFLSRQATLKQFPLLKSEGLRGGLVYYDGQLDDARMCLALALTAAQRGAAVANYVRLLHIADDKLHCRLALMQNVLTGEEFAMQSKCIINATGAETDSIRKLDDAAAHKIALPRIGTHVSLPIYLGSSHCGLLLPSRRLGEDPLLMLPFEQHLLVGGLDVERVGCSGVTAPTPSVAAVERLLQQTRETLEPHVQLQPRHVLSAWTGIRPYIVCPYSSSEQQPVPHFLVEVSDKRMISLAGGRWASYRVMALEAIETAIDYCQLQPLETRSCTRQLLLDGAEDYCELLPLQLVQQHQLPLDVAQHLADSYGSNALELCAHASASDKQRLHPQFPYIEAEVTYACQREYACNLVDVIARRLRVAFVDALAALQLLPDVLRLMSEQHGWTQCEQKQQLRAAQQFLVDEMGLGSIVSMRAKLIAQALEAQQPLQMSVRIKRSKACMSHNLAAVTSSASQPAATILSNTESVVSHKCDSDTKS